MFSDNKNVDIQCCAHGAFLEKNIIFDEYPSSS